VIALDTETCLILPSVLAPPLVCVSWAEGQEAGLLHRTEARDFVFAALGEEETTFANAPFDLAVFIEAWPEIEPIIIRALDDGRIHCVQMREKLSDLVAGTFRFEEDENGDIKYKGYSLDEIARRRLRTGKQFDERRLRYHELYDIPIEQWPEDAQKYAMIDAALTLRVHQAQKDHPNEADQVWAHFALHLISCRGIRTDRDALAKLDAETRTKRDETFPILRAANLARYDSKDDKFKRRTKEAVKRMAKRCLELDIEPKLTKRGMEEAMQGKDVVRHAAEVGVFVSVDAESCSSVDDPVLEAYSRFSRATNLLSSIEALWAGIEIPIQSRFEPLMETGRTSSRGPNIQNPRRAPGVRECFVPREGHVFVAVDVEMAELHTLAQKCIDLFGFSKLGDALNEGKDVHLWLGCMIVGREYDLEAYEAGDEELIVARQLAKVANFGYPGGCGAERFRGIARGYEHPLTKQPIDIDAYQAQRLRALWFQAWPEMHQYFAFVSSCIDDRGWHWALAERAQRLRGRATFTAACNNGFQAPASDGAKAMLVAVTRDQRVGQLRGTYNVNFVHDEIIIETPEHRAHEVGLRAKELMEPAFNVFVPDCPTRVVATAMRRWSKKAKPRYRDGILIPWEDAA
jgi:DNA polymerase I